jgi:hypothetical protein
MFDQEAVKQLERIAVAAEKVAALLRWIALPIYVTVAMFIAWVLLVAFPAWAKH